MAAVADKMFVQEMEPSSLAAPAREAVSAASDAVAAGVSIPWVGIGLVFVVFPILVLAVGEVMKAPNGPAEPEAPAGRSTSGGQAASSSGSAPAERSMPEILSSGLANLKQDPTGWLFGKPSALYSNLPVAPSSASFSATSPMTAAPQGFKGAKELAREAARAQPAQGFDGVVTPAPAKAPTEEAPRS